MEKIQCPRCFTYSVKRNGRTRHNKQRYSCKGCHYQFSENPQNKLISKADLERIDKLLLERITLRGICRVMDISMPWLLNHLDHLYGHLPNHLNIITEGVDFEGYADEKFDTMIYGLLEKKHPNYDVDSLLFSYESIYSEPLLNRGNFLYRLSIGDICDPIIQLFYAHRQGLLLFHYACEADEMWSFVGKKSNKQWIWLAMHTANRQIIGFHVGGRSSKDAEALWNNIPPIFRQKATFFTDYWQAYNQVIPNERHIALGKDSGFTNHQERFNLTLRHRVSRLVRENLAFSKKQENHVGAIKHFICKYNQEIADKLRSKK